MVLTSVYLNLIICLLLLVYQCKQNKAIIYLASLILLGNIRQIIMLLLNEPMEQGVLAVLLVHFDPVTILIGPLLLLYYKSLIQNKLVFEKWFWLYLIPTCLLFANTYAYFFLNFENKVQFASLMQHNNHSDVILPGGTLLFNYDIQMKIVPIHNWAFISYTFIYLHKKKKQNSIKAKISKLIIRVNWLLFWVMLPMLIQILYATLKAPKSFDLSFQDSTISSDIMYMGTLILPLTFLLYPSWLYGNNSSLSILEKLKEIINSISRIVSDEKMEAYEKSEDMNRIIQFIETKKPYLNSNFSLHTLSHELNIPHLRVSGCFSKEIKSTFPEYRNRKRIEYSIQLFKENKHHQMSIEGIAAQCGFKNKSSFYLAFKSEYGMTPSEWMSKNL